jgi:type I restriction enzyme S subunit
LPNKKALFDFSCIVEPLIEKAHQLASESRALAELRDALLPKLMSGELDVDDVEV